MRNSLQNKPVQKILLAGVFGPFGVDDEFGRKENLMELFHNQVTREQGISSFRFHHRTFGLYFLAENIEGDVTVLDFPSKKAFAQEVSNGYDLIGISFIAPNVAKTKEMCRMIRELAPETFILLGGHGTAVEGVEELMDCDHVIRGEGIRPLRTLLGQDPHAPIVHPVLPSTERTSVYGVPLGGTSGSLLVPGVGCVNGCSFCCTSHFFGKQSISFLSSGKELFDTCCRIADERGSEEFAIMDENFLKDRKRAMEFLDEMDRNKRWFGEFHIFSSAEAISSFGVDNLVRLGVAFVWIGVESSSSEGNFEKNVGSDPALLVQQLRDRGILVLASGILCQEHHTPQNIQKDIDFMVSLNADFLQFMLLMPMPVTALYNRHKRMGLLRKDLPYEEWHGQKMQSYRNAAFPGDAPEKVIKRAFRQDYVVNSSSAYRAIENAYRGYCHLADKPELDACLTSRLATIEKRLRDWAPMLSVIVKRAVNDRERTRALELQRSIDARLGRSSGRSLAGLAARALASVWALRVRLFGDGLQPTTIRTHYSGDVARVPKAIAAPIASDIAGTLPRAKVA